MIEEGRLCGKEDSSGGINPIRTLGFLDVKLVISWRKHLALVDVVDAQRLEDLALDEVADAGLGHDGDGDGLLNLLDLGWVGHARDAALGTNVGGYSLEGHDGAGARVLGDAGLGGVRHVHDDAALEHLCQARLDGERGLGATIVRGSGGGGR